MRHRLFAQIVFLLGVVVGVVNVHFHSHGLWVVCGWMLSLSAAALFCIMMSVVNDN